MILFQKLQKPAQSVGTAWEPGVDSGVLRAGRVLTTSVETCRAWGPGNLLRGVGQWKGRGECGTVNGMGPLATTAVAPGKAWLQGCSNWPVGERPKGRNFRRP